jgi:hypothetical protein
MSTPTPIKATGSHLYKYSSPEHLERLKVIILEHELYLPNLAQLNDPADGRPPLAPMSGDQMVSFLRSDFVRRNPGLPLAALEKEAIVIRHNVQKHGPEVLRRIMAKLLNKEMEGFRIYSLSRRYDNLSLWAKYASDHSGYCLEFANEGPLFTHAKEVIYGDSTLMDVMNPEHRSGYWLFCKRQEWSNEEEVRLVSKRGQASRIKIDPHWLKRIILGKNMSEDHRKLVREWARQREPELAVVSAYYDQLYQTLRLSEA